MPFQDEEFLLLSRGGRVPHALSKRPSPDRHVLSKDPPRRTRPREPEPMPTSHAPVGRKSPVDWVLIAAAMTRWLVINAREQRRNRW